MEINKVHNDYLESKKKLLENENFFFDQLNVTENNFILRETLQIEETNDNLVQELKQIDENYEKIRDTLTYTETQAIFDPKNFLIVEKGKRTAKINPKKTTKRTNKRRQKDDEDDDEDSSWEKTSRNKKLKTKK